MNKTMDKNRWSDGERGERDNNNEERKKAGMRMNGEMGTRRKDHFGAVLVRGRVDKICTAMEREDRTVTRAKPKKKKKDE